jgi:hypothetical protein
MLAAAAAVVVCCWHMCKSFFLHVFRVAVLRKDDSLSLLTCKSFNTQVQ